jgi:hypothetical protein
VNILDIARDAGFPVDDYGKRLHEMLERFAAAIKAAHIAELCSVEMPEPVAQLHPAHWKPNADGSEWCREALLYSPNNEGDKLRGVNTRVKLVTLDQCREAVAAAVAKKDAEIAELKADLETERNHVLDRRMQIDALTAERDALRKLLDEHWGEA